MLAISLAPHMGQKCDQCSARFMVEEIQKQICSSSSFRLLSKMSFPKYCLLIQQSTGTVKEKKFEILAHRLRTVVPFDLNNVYGIPLSAPRASVGYPHVGGVTPARLGNPLRWNGGCGHDYSAICLIEVRKLFLSDVPVSKGIALVVQAQTLRRLNE